MDNVGPVEINQNSDFTAGVVRAFKKIDGEAFIKRAPVFTFWLIMSALASWLLIHQSILLYEKAGFSNANLAAAGGLLLVVGSAAYYSVARSFIAILLCLYAGSYEGYLMISGSFNDDRVVIEQEILNKPELAFLKEKADKEMDNYKRQEARYHNPESEVFENGWFKKNFVTPAWEASTNSHEAYLAKKNALLVSSSKTDVTWLKILYRLGLVFLCMIFVHRVFGGSHGKYSNVSRLIN